MPPLVSYYNLPKNQKISGFLMFSWGYRKRPVAFSLCLFPIRRFLQLYQKCFFGLEMKVDEQETNLAVITSKENISLQNESTEITCSRATSADETYSQAASSDLSTTAVKLQRTKSESNEVGLKSKSPLIIQYFSGNPMVEVTKGILHILKDK